MSTDAVVKAEAELTLDIMVDGVEAVQELIGDAMTKGYRNITVSPADNDYFWIRIRQAQTFAGPMMSDLMQLLARHGDQATRHKIIELTEFARDETLLSPNLGIHRAR